MFGAPLEHASFEPSLDGGTTQPDLLRCVRNRVQGTQQIDFRRSDVGKSYPGRRHQPVMDTQIGAALQLDTVVLVDEDAVTRGHSN